MNTTYKIRIASTLSDKKRAFQFIKSIFYDELNRFQLFTPEFTGDFADENTIFLYVEDAGNIIACTRIKKTYSGDGELKHTSVSADIAGKPICYVSRFAVKKSHRNSRLGLMLFNSCHRWALDNGIEYAIIEAEKCLTSMYEKLGFQVIGARKNCLGEDRFQMLIDPWNFHHLEEINSPFLAYLKQKLDAMVLEWSGKLSRQIPEAVASQRIPADSMVC